jgi:hypothetical protein
MKATAEVIQFQKKQEAKFVCSACGADRGCQCNAPAVEKVAAEMERQRQKARAYYQKKKSEQNQSPSTGRNGNDVDPEESAEERKAEFYDGPRPPSPRERRLEFCVWCDRVIRDAHYEGPIDQEIIDMITGAIDKFRELKGTLEETKEKQQPRHVTPGNDFGTVELGSARTAEEKRAVRKDVEEKRHGGGKSKTTRIGGQS